MATRQPCAGTALLLPRAMSLGQSLRLADGKILILGVDRRAGAFVLTQHLRSGLLDESFGELGMQRIASDLAHNASALTLETHAGGGVVLRGTLVDDQAHSQGSWQLQILPDGEVRSRADRPPAHWLFSRAMTGPDPQEQPGSA